MIAAGGRPLRTRPVIAGAIGVAWALALAAELTGRGDRLHHDWLIGGDLRPEVAFGLFLLTWQAMIAAMMLPSALPLIALQEHIGRSQPRAAQARAAFLGGYGVVWTAFGAVAFIGDLTLHRLVHATPWLDGRPWLIGGSALVLSGVFQFSDLKDRCLKECRMPAQFLMKHYRRGVGAGFRLGVAHGVFCVGCCWALMLLMFAAGVANLAWMAPLTALMVYEKIGRHGDRIVRPAGVALILIGALTVMRGTLP